MNHSEKQYILLFLNLKLEILKCELDKYDGSAYTFLELESVGKIRRYGKDYYKNNYLKNPMKNVSDFMPTFVYLKNMEDQLNVLKKDIITNKTLIESNLDE